MSKNKSLKPGDEGWEPDWLSDENLRTTPYTEEELLELALGIREGIRDTPAWLELVGRVGEEEALQTLIEGIRWQDPRSENGPVF
jgi:hypothetical protein